MFTYIDQIRMTPQPLMAYLPDRRDNALSLFAITHTHTHLHIMFTYIDQIRVMLQALVAHLPDRHDHALSLFPVCVWLHFPAAHLPEERLWCALLDVLALRPGKAYIHTHTHTYIRSACTKRRAR